MERHAFAVLQIKVSLQPEKSAPGGMGCPGRYGLPRVFFMVFLNLVKKN